MRNPHWNGNPPRDDAHAREMIVNAALTVAHRGGLKKTNIKEVAEELGITRQTVYRLFPSTDELLTAVSVAAGGKILDRVLKAVTKFSTFEDRAVECLVFLARNIPEDDFMKRYFVPTEENTADIENLFSEESMGYAVQFLKALHPAPQTLTNEIWLRELSEHMLRTLLALVIAPTKLTNTPKGIRQYLNRWLRPVLNDAQNKQD